MKQIFVSSTFKDMHIERDLIQTKLTPDLNEKAYEKRIEGIQFQDLRWGIDTDMDDEEAKDKKILEVCLDEIDNNRPYFFVLLGDRYGWIPENDLVKETGVLYGIYDKDEKIEKSITHLEIDYGFLKNPKYAKDSYAYIRNIIGDVRGTVYEQNPAEKEKIEALKAEIRECLPASNIHEYDVVIKDGKLIGVDKFVDLAKADMTKVLFENQILKEDLTENQKEILYHKTQAEEKSIVSNARKNIEESILKEIKNNNVITVKGKSGNGKSTLMAKLSRQIRKESNSIILFSSLTPKTTSAVGIMRTVTEYIKEVLAKESDYSIDLDSLANKNENPANDNPQSNQGKFLTEEGSAEEKQYESALREYSLKGKREIIILIDAIDQLDNPEEVASLIKPLNFINDSKIKFIISYLEEDSATDSDDYIFLNDFLNYKLTELSEEDKLEVINSSLRDNNKELPIEIKKAIIAKEGSKSPLYISLLVQRLLMMNSEDYLNIIRAGDGYEKITTYQKDLIQKMPNDLKDLILNLITYAAKTLNTNTDDIKETINYLAVSRRGLRESDLKRIYELNGKSYNALDFATLKKFLRAFFLEDKHLRIDFTHKIIRQAVLESLTYTKNIACSDDIANAFMYLPAEDPIKLQEQYYSAYQAQNREAAIELLVAIGSNADKLDTDEVESAMVAISKIHNTRINSLDEKWMKDIFKELYKLDLSIQKVLMAYFVYSSYEEGTSESIKASIHYGTGFLTYLERILKDHPTDQDIIRYYADQLTFVGMKTSSSRNEDFNIAEEKLLMAVNLNELLADLNPLDTNIEQLANVYSNIAKLYLDHGDRKKAKVNYEKSISLFKKLSDKNKTIISLENLAVAYNSIANLYAEGNEEDGFEAKKYYKESIRIINNLLKKHESISLKKTVAMGYINMASLYFSENNIRKAEKWYFRSIDAIKNIETIEPSLENKETLAKAYNNVADLFASELIDDRAKAEEFYFMAMRVFESILNIKPIISVKKNLSVTYDNIGNLYSDWKEDEAYTYYKKAIDIKEEMLAISASKDEITDLATSYNNLGFLYVDNRTDDSYALECYERAIDLLHTIEQDEIDKNYGENLAVCYTNLGGLYYLLKDMEKSVEYYKKAIHIHKNLIGQYQDDDIIEKLLIIYNNLGCYMTDMDFDLVEVEEGYLEVIELIKILEDPYKKRKKTAITYNNLANLYLIKDKNFELSEKCYLKSVDLTKWVIDYHLSVENLERLMVNYYNLSKLYELWGKDDLKEEYFNLAKSIEKNIDYNNNQENINKFIYNHQPNIQ